MSSYLVSRDAETRALFSALDRDKNGYVDKSELRETMKEIGLDLSDVDLDLMMRAAVFKDRLFYEDFIRLMTGSVGRLHRKAVKLKLEEKAKRRRSSILRNIHEPDDEIDNPDIQAMRVAFALFDRNGDGLLTEDDIEATMKSLEVSFSQQNIQKIIEKVNQNASGKMHFGDFRAVMSDYYRRISPFLHFSSELPADPTKTIAATAAAEQTADDQTADKTNHCCRNEELVTAAFKVFDKDKDGYLNAVDLRSTMKQLGLILTEDDVRAMMRSVGIGPLGKISFTDFCRIYRSKTALSAEKHSLKRTRRKPKIPKRLEAELRGVFEIFDLDGDEFITITEVADVLRSMGLNPSIDSIQDVFHQVDLDGNGKIDFREFLLLMMKYERPLPGDLETREMFNALDRDKNGFIDPSDLKSSFAGLGIQLTNLDVQLMMEEVGAVENSRIGYNDFVQILQRNFGQKLRFFKTLNELHSTEFVSDAEGSTSKERLPDASTETVSKLDESEHSARNSSGSGGPNCLPQIPVPNIAMTTDGEMSDTMKVANDACMKFLEATTMNNTSNNINKKITSEESKGLLSETIRNKTSSSSGGGGGGWKLSSRRGSRWDSIFTPSSVAAFCKTQDAYCTTPNTWIAFKVFDRNADGYISKAELQQTMTELGVKLSSDELDAMMGEADINKDGRIDYTEFSRLMKGSFEKYAKKATRLHEMNQTNTKKVSENGALVDDGRKFPEEEEIRTAFMVFDMDCNGLIDASELRMTMLHLGKSFSKSQVEAMIKAVDRNQDGKIDYGEFLEMMRTV